MSQKSKAKTITSIQMWVDAFLIFANIYVTAHTESATTLFEYMYTIRLGASRTIHLGRRKYDVQFWLIKERNPSIFFFSVDSELWLNYMHQSLQSQFRVSDPRPFKLSAMISIKSSSVRGTIVFTSTNAIVTRIHLPQKPTQSVF